MAESVSVPQGFTLDSPGQSSSNNQGQASSVPQGFTIDQQDDSNDNQDKPEGFSDIDNPSSVDQKSNNPNSTGNPVTDIAGDLARGLLNSGAGTADKINGVVKLLKTATTLDLGSEGLTNVSNKLKQLASQQPQSSNPIVSGIDQTIGSVPDALAEFAGSGGGIGFIARSAALSAADAYNKSQSPTDAIKGVVVGGTVGAALDRLPGVIEGAGQMAKKWGQTAGKTYIQAVTGASDADAQEIIDKLPTMDVNPKSKVEDYDAAKEDTNTQLATLNENNKNLIEQQKAQHTKEYNATKSASDDAVNNLIENNRDTIDDLRASQSQYKEDLNSSNSTNMMAATDAATQKLADATTATTVNVVKAKNAVDNTLVSTFDTASKKLSTMEKGVTDDVANAHASLENNNLDYVPTAIIKNELDSTIGNGSGRFYKNMSSGKRTLNIGGQKIEVPEESIGGINGKSIQSKIAPAEGTGTNAVSHAVDLINSTRNGLVDEFSSSGKTSLAAIEAQSKALEGAIDKGFSGQAVPKGLVVTMARIKQAINPTRLFQKYPKELSHLEPLANANKSYSTQIDGLRNALDLYKDNVDGTINPEKVFKALDRNDSGYIAKLKQADEALPPQDRIFDKVKSAYDNYKAVESSEKMALSKTEKAISNQRLGLSKKFDNMRKQLNVEQRKELLSKIKETRANNRAFKQEKGKALQDLHTRQRQALDVMQVQKDKELGELQKSVNERLHSLHILHMARGARASASGTAKIFQNVGNYRSIDGLSTFNIPKMVQGSVISKLASPSGASNTIKSLLNATQSLQGVKKLAGNVVLKRLLATKLSGR